jgi:hypothetical protein
VAKVLADYSQYEVAAGPDLTDGGDLIPGLLYSMGPQGVAVITGVQYGRVKVSARGLTAPPAAIEPGWDVVAETDLDCPEGELLVLDWAGPGHPELGELATAGPGRYRLRVHARRRDDVGRGKTAEEHYLLTWPVTDPAPPALLTPMDECGRIFTSEFLES